MIKALAFVPPNLIVDFYTSLRSSFTDGDVIKISNWFEKNYVHATLKYGHQFWSIYDKDNLKHYLKTTNNV